MTRKLAGRTGIRKALEAAGVIFVAENGEGPGGEAEEGASLDLVLPENGTCLFLHVRKMTQHQNPDT